ncbi:PBP superfamily domain-containing protein [Malonomonas rubra DSM 5091]|uniref:PBP superfamily domain-containing protein n=1 Tax=Malonomonas rubra DSM 5091 TaxID=1122189 RepID=A0A1M6JHY9_MALRU|nr:substrate-binding domain-containing protein [Malonomonas rubra]SHJ46283.1 PBP superfamily domain-containing protein [Malonomonas rubra DSM 5091]
MRFATLLAGLLFTLTCANAPLADDTKQMVAGAGPSTAVAQLFFQFLSKKPEAADYHFYVPATSAKHAGGIKNSDDYLFGRIGRPFNAEEKKLGKIELFLAKVPFVFVIGPKVGLNRLTLDQVAAIFLGRIENWKDLGGPDTAIKVIGRESSEAFFAALKAAYPQFSNSSFDLILKRDNEVVDYLKTDDGAYSIAFGSKPNFSFINILDVTDFEIGVNIGLTYDQKNADHKVVKAARRFAESTEWRGGLSMLGLLPADL